MFDDAEGDLASVRTARHLFKQAYNLQQRGALADAMRLYKESLAVHPTAEAHTFLGWAYATLRRYEDAMDECLKAITLDPTFGNPYNDIGAYCIELARWEEAIQWFNKALIAPHYANREFAFLNIGRVHEHFGRYLKAAEYYQQALRLNPNYQSAHLAYQLILGKLN
jgi:Tfp pilus assembly protein PilF